MFVETHEARSSSLCSCCYFAIPLNISIFLLIVETHEARSSLCSCCYVVVLLCCCVTVPLTISYCILILCEIHSFAYLTVTVLTVIGYDVLFLIAPVYASYG